MSSKRAVVDPDRERDHTRTAAVRDAHSTNVGRENLIVAGRVRVSLRVVERLKGFLGFIAAAGARGAS
jgi:hypothetical protein